MPGTDRPVGPGGLRRFWQNLWGQDPDLRPQTRWKKFMAFCGLHVPPPARQDRLHIRPRFFKVIGLHNPDLAEAILREGKQTAERAGGMVGKP